MFLSDMPFHAQAMKLQIHTSCSGLKNLKVDDVDVVIPVSYWNGDTELYGKSGRRKRNELRMQLIGFYRFYCLGEAVSR